MYQVNFSDQAMRALGKLPTLEQMEVVDNLYEFLSSASFVDSI